MGPRPSAREFGEIGLPAGVGFEVSFMDIGDHADDADVCLATEVDHAAYGILIGKQELEQPFG